MGDRTAISWTDATWNPVRGCSRVSEGCRHCYAERLAARFCGPGEPYEGLAIRKLKVIGDEQRMEGRWTGAVTLAHQRLSDPMRWRRPRKIFVNSMSDLFHEALPDEHIALVFGVMLIAQQHTYQVLTKRALGMREWFSRWSVDQCIEVAARYSGPDGRHLPGPKPWNRSSRPEWRDVEAWPVPWIWNGVSVENQAAADERIPHLLATPAGLRFLSMEPLLEETDLNMPRCDDEHHGHAEWGVADDEATPWCIECDTERSYSHWLHPDGGIDWVIAGCESGPRARPCAPAWLRRIRDQCAEAEVPFFLKQATEEGSWAGDAEYECTVLAGDNSKHKAGGVVELPYLDGVQHAAFPEQAP